VPLSSKLHGVGSVASVVTAAPGLRAVLGFPSPGSAATFSEVLLSNSQWKVADEMRYAQCSRGKRHKRMNEGRRDDVLKYLR
jgi:hypothetical protein